MWDEGFKRKADVASEVRDWLEARIKELEANYLKANESEEGELDYWVQITNQRYSQLAGPAKKMADSINADLDEVT